MADAAGWLLFLLPVLFVPLYVPPLLDAPFWARWGAGLLPGALLGTAMTLVTVRALAGRMVRR